MTLRMYNRQTRCWSIYWLDNAGNGLDPATSLLLLPPVVGGFKDGVGVFVGLDAFEGRPITVKFVWSAITRTSARWHQEFSADQGRTWETNWINEMTKLDD